MVSWNQAWREGLVGGSAAALLSALYLVVAGQRRDQPAAPINAVSHWIFGNRALRADHAEPRYTATGYLIHHGASLFWGLLHAKAWGARPEAKAPLPAAAGAVAAAAVACFADYQLTPKRLTPGFEHRLDTREMVAVYACFAAGLGLASWWMGRRR